jgi:hypothetical protein
MKYRVHNNGKPEIKRRLIACIIEAAGGVRKTIEHFQLEQTLGQLRAWRQLQGGYFAEFI